MIRISKRRRLLLVVSCIVLLGLVVAVFVVPSKKTPPPAIPTATSGRYWIMSTHALNQVAADINAKQALTGDTIYVTTNQNEQLSSQTDGLHLVRTADFTSEAALDSAIHNHTIAAGTQAILYDNENWSLTPANERDNMALYYGKASRLAHDNGYLLISTPGKSTAQVATEIAPYSDVYDIQSQYDQDSSSAYISHVLPVAQAARAANNKVTILSGLSTNPSAGIPTVSELIADAKGVYGPVQGFWLNIPSPGTACPRCNAPQPQLAIQFLTTLGKP